MFEKPKIFYFCFGVLFRDAKKNQKTLEYKTELTLLTSMSALFRKFKAIQHELVFYSTVTLFARLRGLSGLIDFEIETK